MIYNGKGEVDSESETKLQDKIAELRKVNMTLRAELAGCKKINETMGKGEAEAKEIKTALLRANRELTAVNTLSRRVSASLSLEQVTGEALRAVWESVLPDLAVLYLREGDRLTLRGVQPENGKYRHENATSHRVGECLCGLAVQKNKAIFSSDIHLDPQCTLQECKKAGMHSFAALPLRSGDNLIGILGLASAEKRDFKKQATFLETLANEIAVGLQNALLYEQVRLHAGRLEQRVTERTARLQEKTAELELANFKLKEADRMKSVFFASMSHELIIPLNSIIGFTGILLMGMAGKLNPEQEKQLTIVKHNAGHILDLVNDMLDMSRIEAGKVKLFLEEFDLGAVVEEVVKTFSHRLSEKGLEMITAIPGGITLFSDVKRVKQVVKNLVDNAVRFTRRGNIKISGRVLTPQKLEISVADTGMGLKKETMEKLFLPFQHTPMTYGNEFKGAGLGLHLCKNLLRFLGGDIRAHSEYGKGSVFTFVLPLRYTQTGMEAIPGEQLK